MDAHKCLLTGARYSCHLGGSASVWKIQRRTLSASHWTEHRVPNGGARERAKGAKGVGSATGGTMMPQLLRVIICTTSVFQWHLAVKVSLMVPCATWYPKAVVTSNTPIECFFLSFKSIHLLYPLDLGLCCSLHSKGSLSYISELHFYPKSLPLKLCSRKSVHTLTLITPVLLYHYSLKTKEYDHVFSVYLKHICKHGSC